MENIVGIDLGTTNACVAVVECGRAVVIPNRGGYTTTPSFVAVSERRKRLVGYIAKRQAVTNPRNTVQATKRLIGRRWDSRAEGDERLFPANASKGPRGDIRVQLGDRLYSAPEIGAHILAEMREAAERYLGESVSRAVVTVPAYFNDNQRRATRDAGRIAGLEIVRIINEPTAAALAFGLERDFGGRIAVYDFGGGTFDISILDVDAGVYSVSSSAGDTYLGGEDFDRRVVAYLEQIIRERHSVDVQGDPVASQRLKDAAENARCELSICDETFIELPFLHTDTSGTTIHFKELLTREHVERLTADLVERTIGICAGAFAQTDSAPKDVDAVVLVGGLTRMPLVRRRVAEFFGQQPCGGVHPDEAVALGAATQAAALVDPSIDVLLLDVTPQDLGIMTAGGEFHRLIRRNTTIPTATRQSFTTVRDGQNAMRIVVLQGQSEDASNNELLAEFVVGDLPAATRGSVLVEVTFTIDCDGMLSVSAKETQTGREQRIVVTANSDLSEEEIRVLAEEHARCSAARRARRRRVPEPGVLPQAVPPTEPRKGRASMRWRDESTRRGPRAANSAGGWKPVGSER